MLLDERAAQFRRIVGAQPLELVELAARIVERPAIVHLAQVNLGLKSQRMAKLIDGVGLTCAALLDYLSHAAQVSIQQIDLPPADQQPAAAVYPGAPIAKTRHEALKMTIVEFTGCCVKLFGRERRVGEVVKAEVDVGVGTCSAAGPGAAERDRLFR